MSGIKGACAGILHGGYKHGQTNTRLFKIWTSMHERCERKKHVQFYNYGGRGISVCKEWDEFLPFSEWAKANGYDDSLTLDRIDGDKGYCPENCRWTTWKVQQNNKRTNHHVEYGGETYTLTQLAEKIGMNKTTLRERLNSGWSVEDAVNKPVRARTRGYRMSHCGARMES